MILEALMYAASWPAAGAAGRGQLSASVSLWSRARRCRADWAPHEARCKAAISTVVAGLRPRRTAVVLGSGLCRDVPIDLLSRSFETVVLVDLVHLLPVRLMAARRRNLRLVERDLAGPDGLAFLRQVPYLDLVISANLLSQLPIGLARRRGAPLSPEEGAFVIAGHLSALNALPAPALLLTDTAFRAVDGRGRENPETDLLFSVTPPPAFDSWIWTVVPAGEEDDNYRIDHRVIAARLGAPARQGLQISAERPD